MAQYNIKKSRIVKFVLPKGYDLNTLQIGIPVLNGEAEMVGLNKIGDIVLPSSKFGIQSRKNAHGFSYPDKTKPKERRYVTTIWGHPYGNMNASSSPLDIYRPCYPKVEEAPYGIELQLYEGEDDKKYVIADLTTEIRNYFLKEVVNLFLEIYGECYIFDEKIKIDNLKKRERCNWELLPPGEKPSIHMTKQLRASGQTTDTYDVFRLDSIEKYSYEKVVEGINGFEGYYAYLFDKYCVLESAVYGNATYIIERENWEIMSQKTKKELLDNKCVIDKLIHTKEWRDSINKVFNNLGIK